MSLADQPAFPTPETGGHSAYGEYDPKLYDRGQYGMTYRQWLVGMALQGLLANPNVIYGRSWTEETVKDVVEKLGTWPLAFADAAIRAQEGK